MHSRQPLPRLWLMTDERLGADLPIIVRRLPRGSGIIFRHYSLPPAQRRMLFEQVRAIARGRGLTLMLAGPPKLAAMWGAEGSHGYWGGRRGPLRLLRSVPAHDLLELRQAAQCGADFVLVSPVFPTRSHPRARTLGRLGLARLAQRSRCRVIALGGMNASRGKRLQDLAYGWAGIDAFA